jgi:Zn-dependent protease
MFLMELFRNPYYFFGTVVIVMLSVSFHEFAHALAAQSQGDNTAARAGRLTLNPMAHMSSMAVVLLIMIGITFGSTPVNRSRFRHWFSDAIVSFAGPLANLLLVVGALLFQNRVPPAWQVFLELTAMLNAYLFLLNLIPLPPLDGFGILETFVPALRPLGHRLSPYGFLILMSLFFVLNLGDLLFGTARHLVSAISGLLPYRI